MSGKLKYKNILFQRKEIPEILEVNPEDSRTWNNLGPGTFNFPLPRLFQKFRQGKKPGLLER